MVNSMFKYSINSSINSAGIINYEVPVSYFFNNILLYESDNINVLVYTIGSEPQIRMIAYDSEKIKYILYASKTSTGIIITYIVNRFIQERNESQIQYNNLYQDNRFLTTMLSHRN